MPAAVDLHEEVPELLPPQHVDEKVGGGVDAGGEVGQGYGNLHEVAGGAAALALAHHQLGILLAEHLVQVRDELDALAHDEEDGDAHQGEGQALLVQLLAADGRRDLLAAAVQALALIV